MVASTSIIDSHVHLWPDSAANPQGHAWMEEGALLTRQHIIEDYLKVARLEDTEVEGIIYLETDRRLEESTGSLLEAWAGEPLNEIRFLRSIVERGYGDEASTLLSGIVLWAPIDQGIHTFEQWLTLAEKTAGVETWKRVKGFRFLLQGITNRNTFEKLVSSADFITILQSFHTEERDFSFDVGISQHSAGVWQLEAFVDVIERVHAGTDEHLKTTFILNHLCKPNLAIGPEATKSSEDFKRWYKSMQRFAGCPQVYIKLSGAFSELSTTRVDTSSPAGIAERMGPWLNHVLSVFPADRIMYGSDWPVCNIRGPIVEKSWPVWTRVVQTVLKGRGLSKEDQRMIWSGTARKAYRLVKG